MPATPVYALPYPAATDPADVPADLKKLADQVALILGGALSATPPASPTEGQLWALPAAAGTVWLFRYNAGSASAFKWEFAGGGSLEAESAAEVASAAGTYAATGAQVTVPRAGEYEVSFGAGVRPDPGWYVLVAPKIGAAAVSDTNAASSFNAAAGTPTLPFTVARTLKLTCAAGDVLALHYRSQGGTGRAQANWLSARPFRVS